MSQEEYNLLQRTFPVNLHTADIGFYLWIICKQPFQSPLHISKKLRNTPLQCHNGSKQLRDYQYHHHSQNASNPNNGKNQTNRSLVTAFLFHKMAPQTIFQKTHRHIQSKCDGSAQKKGRQHLKQCPCGSKQLLVIDTNYNNRHRKYNQSPKSADCFFIHVHTIFSRLSLFSHLPLIIHNKSWTVT